MYMLYIDNINEWFLGCGNLVLSSSTSSTATQTPTVYAMGSPTTPLHTSAIRFPLKQPQSTLKSFSKGNPWRGQYRGGGWVTPDIHASWVTG